MSSQSTTLSLSKQTLIRLIIDHSQLDESVGAWAVGYEPAAGDWGMVWVGRYPHPVEGHVTLRAGWKSVALPRIRSHKYAKRLDASTLGRHVETALAEGALRNWLAAQRHSGAPCIELT